MPMLIIDSPSVIKNRLMFSARGAGILGFSIFGADRTYALNDDMEIDFKAIEDFLLRHQGQKILLFGFTFMIWQHFYKELLKSTKKIDLSQGILIHGGGWKKLISEAVSPEEFDHGGTRDRAARLSDADYLLCLTQDALPADEYLVERLSAPFADRRVKAAYARQLPREDCRELERYTRSFNYPEESRVKTATG